MNAAEQLAALERIGRPKILVVGDVLLDRYTWGDAERISQEAPVLVLRAEEEEARLGGAANVANMLAGLDAEVTCAGVVGRDAAGRELQHLVAQAQIRGDGLIADDGRPTTEKQRFVGRAGQRHPSQILRVDREVCDPLSTTIEARLLKHLERVIPGHDAILISDYAKGVCTPAVTAGVLTAANAARIPVLVDPNRDGDFAKYSGAALLKPNRSEAQRACGLTIDSQRDALTAGQQLCEQLAVQTCLITLDQDGMAVVHRDGSGRVFATEAREVYDITGAGDMVLAMLGAAVAADVDIHLAAQLANTAAGIEVERSGVAIVTRDEIRDNLLSRCPARQPAKVLPLDELDAIIQQHRDQDRRIVMTNGCFDLLHVGHVAYLAEAARQGDLLIVAINSDASVGRLKGPARPVIGQQDRAAMLAALACVDHVVIFDTDTPHHLLETLRPDVLVKGGTYRADEVVGREIVERYGGEVYLAGLVDGISTTNILRSIQPPNRKAG